MLRFYVLMVLHQTAYGDVIYASVGGNVTFPCFFTSTANHLSWYKQVAGEQPQIVSYFYKGSGSIFYNNFTQGRFSARTRDGFYNLSISNIQDSDSALYFCGHISIKATEFIKGTLLVLKESSCASFLQQHESESVPAGGFVSLNCTVLPGTNDGEHNVYWLKRDLETSPVGMMLIHANSSKRKCKGGSSACSCVYSWSKRDVQRPDAGMYHCAMASCGRVLFSSGTELYVEEKNSETAVVHYVVAALAVSLMLNIVLFILCRRRENLPPEGPCEPEPTTDSQNEATAAVQYAALDFKQRKEKSSRQRSSEEETLYSGVRFSHSK